MDRVSILVILKHKWIDKTESDEAESRSRASAAPCTLFGRKERPMRGDKGEESKAVAFVPEHSVTAVGFWAP